MKPTLSDPSRTTASARSPQPELPLGETPAADLDVLDDLARLARSYIEANQVADTPVVEQCSAAELERLLDLRLGDDGVPERELLPLVEQYLRYAVRTGHPQFHNQLFSGFTLAGFLGEVVACLSNTTMSTFEASPVATLMERRVLERMRALAGYEGGEGIFCTGGSNANLLGLLCARQRAFPDVGRRGLPVGVAPQAFVSDQAHYSYAKAAKVLGIGTDNLVSVATDERGRMDAGALARAIDAGLRAGRTPFFVGATAGTTVLGAYDPLHGLADIAGRHGLWLHVDGSWGGSALVSPRWRHLLAGSERSDSMAWDAHKMLGATLSCSAFLARHVGALHAASSAEAGDSGYLFHEGEAGQLDSGRDSLQCGRRVDSLKLWLLWRRHGERGLAARVDRLFELAELARAAVERHGRMQLVGGGEAPNVCFRWLPSEGTDPDAFNLALREHLLRSGRAFVNYAHVAGRLVIRLVLSNADLAAADVERFFQHVEEAAQALESEGPGAPRSDPPLPAC